MARFDVVAQFHNRSQSLNCRCFYLFCFSAFSGDDFILGVVPSRLIIFCSRRCAFVSIDRTAPSLHSHSFPCTTARLQPNTMRREVFFALQAAFLLLVVLSLYLGHDQLSQISSSFLKPNHGVHVNGTQASVSAPAHTTTQHVISISTIATTIATTTVAKATATKPAANGEFAHLF